MPYCIQSNYVSSKFEAAKLRNFEFSHFIKKFYIHIACQRLSTMFFIAPSNNISTDNNNHTIFTSVNDFHQFCYFATIFAAVGILINLLIITALLFENRLLKKKFSCYILFQCSIDVFYLSYTTVFNNLPYMWNFGVYCFINNMLYTSSLWLLVYRSFIQQRAVVNIPATPAGHQTESKSKLNTLICTSKILIVLLIVTSILCYIFPITYVSLNLQYFSIGCFIPKCRWNYVIVATNFCFLFIPAIFMTVCAVKTALTLRRLKLDANVFRATSGNFEAWFRRLTQSSFIVFAFIFLFFVSFTPLQIYYMYCTKVNIFPAAGGYIVYYILQSTSLSFYVFNPCIVLCLSSEIRSSCVLLIRRCFTLSLCCMKM